MSASVEILQDPYWYPDSVAAVGAADTPEVTLMPAATRRERRRPGDPVAAIRGALAAAGVVYGLDEAALAQVVAEAAGGWRGTAVVARGQEPQSPLPDQWEWEPLPLGLTEAGQVVGVSRSGRPNLPRKDVTGTEEWIYPDVENPRLDLGPGLRRLPDGRIAAMQKGRLQVRTAADGSIQADVVACRVLEGDPPPGTVVECTEDIVVTGSLREAHLRTTGAVVVAGGAAGSEIVAAAIAIGGTAEGCRLETIPAGHAAPFLGHLRLLGRQIADLAGAGDTAYLQAFRRAQASLRHLSDLLRRIPRLEPNLAALMTQCGRLLYSSPEEVTGGRAAALAAEVERHLARFEQETAHLGGVELRGDVQRCQVWSARDIVTGGERLYASELYAGRDIRCLKGTVAQSELIAARHAVVMGSTGKKGSASSVRAGLRAYLGEAVPGTLLEVAGQSYQFRAEMFQVGAHLSSRYELQMRQGSTPPEQSGP